MKKIYDDFLEYYQGAVDMLNSAELSKKERNTLVRSMKISVGFLMVKAKDTHNEIALAMLKDTEEKLRELEKE